MDKAIVKFKKKFNILKLNRIDICIQYLLDNFNSNSLDYKDILNFVKLNKEDNIQPLINLYLHFEFLNYLLKIFLDNPNLLNGYFYPRNNIYELFGEDIMLLMFIKINSILNYHKMFPKYTNFLKYFDKLNLDFFNIFDNRFLLQNNFFVKDLDFDLKKNILTKLFDKCKKKIRIRIYIALLILKIDNERNLYEKSFLFMIKLGEEMEYDNNRLKNINFSNNLIDYKLFKDFLETL